MNWYYEQTSRCDIIMSWSVQFDSEWHSYSSVVRYIYLYMCVCMVCSYQPFGGRFWSSFWLLCRGCVSVNSPALLVFLLLIFPWFDECSLVATSAAVVIVRKMLIVSNQLRQSKFRIRNQGSAATFRFLSARISFSIIVNVIFNDVFCDIFASLCLSLSSPLSFSSAIQAYKALLFFKISYEKSVW